MSYTGPLLGPWQDLSIDAVERKRHGEQYPDLWTGILIASYGWADWGWVMAHSNSRLYENCWFFSKNL